MSPEQIRSLPLTLFHGVRCHAQLIEAPSPGALDQQLALWGRSGWMHSSQAKMIQMGINGPCYKTIYYPELYLALQEKEVTVVDIIKASSGKEAGHV
jgi:hypothetical protein